MNDVFLLKGFGALPKGSIQRLYGLGLYRGAKLALKHKAPLGCPIAVDVNGTLISLRQSEFTQLELITV
jgi:ferrous iron transport protein A